MCTPLALLASLLVAAVGAGCAHPAPAGDGLPDAVVLGPVDAGKVLDADATALVAAYRDLGFALYGHLRAGDADLVFSPLALNTALAMTYAGATGTTATEMAQVLGLPGTPASLPAAHHTAMTVLATGAARGGETELATATRLWFDQARQLQPAYATTLAQDFSAPAVALDFAHQGEPSRTTINAWVARQTHGRIPTLLGPDAVGAGTTTVQTAALYFHGRWTESFTPDPGATTPFYGLGGAPTQVAMLRRTADLGTVQGGSFIAVALPYSDGAASLLAVMPTGDFHAFEATFDGSALAAIDAALSVGPVELAMPAFETTVTLPSLLDTLAAMGMTLATSDAATFDIVDGPVKITEVVEQAYIRVDADGTEAAAAAAVIEGATAAAPDFRVPVPVTLDHPFLYFIRDAATGSVLFMGRHTQASP